MDSAAELESLSEQKHAILQRIGTKLELPGDLAHLRELIKRSLNILASPRDLQGQLLWLDNGERLRWVDLEREKNRLQLRLGTHSEQPGDMERVQTVVHDLRNLLGAARGREELARFDEALRAETAQIKVG